MKSNKTSVYALKNGKFQVSTYDNSGSRVRRKFASKKEAEVFAKAVSRDLVLLSPTANPPLRKLIDAYIEDEKNNERLMRRGMPLIDSFSDRFGLTPVKEVSQLDLEFWLGRFAKTQGYSSRTKRAAKNALSPFFSDLVRKKIIDVNPFDDVVVKLGTRKKHHTYLSKAEVRKILEGLREVSPDECEPVTTFFAHTACIPCEALTLKWSDLDLENGFVQFNGTGQTARRKLRISDTLRDFLKRHPVRSEFVFTDAKGRPWTNSLYAKRLRVARSAIGLAKFWDNFAFRHSVAYHFLRGGGSMAHLQVILGHRHIEHTRQAYGKILSLKDQMLSPYNSAKPAASA